jgi:flagellin
MSLIINHNLEAMKASRHLGQGYGKLSKSLEKLSSGLRINSADDDAAGLAIREMMRADIATGHQGIRNASDAISLIQTADGALAVIDEKLTRMKELAEQAATGTYTDLQRSIINSEYQAMATEIDRIANATNFNGIKLLDGSMNNKNGGQGIRIHFGTGNSAAEDYYYVKTDDVRATSSSGLKVGGDGKNDIWSTGSYGGLNGSCCGGVISSLDQSVISSDGQGFAYGYNWDGEAKSENDLFNSKYLAGRYEGKKGTTYQELAENINKGSQSWVKVDFSSALTTQNNSAGFLAICIDNTEVYHLGSAKNNPLVGIISGKISKQVAAGGSNAAQFASAINNTANSKYWAMASGTGGTASLLVFRKDGGDNNHLFIEERVSSASDAKKVSFVNAQNGKKHDTIMNFSLGGEHWGKIETSKEIGRDAYNLTLLGRDMGDGKDLYIAKAGASVTGTADGDFSAKLTAAGIKNRFVTPLSREAFAEIQDAADGNWHGAEIRTQEAAQKSLLAINNAIERKMS